MTHYFCHGCGNGFDSMSESVATCPQCDSEFIEMTEDTFEPSSNPAHEQPVMIDLDLPTFLSSIMQAGVNVTGRPQPMGGSMFTLGGAFPIPSRTQRRARSLRRSPRFQRSTQPPSSHEDAATSTESANEAQSSTDEEPELPPEDASNRPLPMDIQEMMNMLMGAAAQGDAPFRAFGIATPPGQGPENLEGMPAFLRALFGMTGNPGDYMTQNGLEQFMSQLFEQHRTVPEPASEEAIGRLPRRKYTAPATALSEAPSTAEECSICTDEFKEEEDTVLVLPCHHIFHEPCLLQWLKNSGTCPVCRKRVDGETEEQKKEDEMEPQQSGSQSSS